MNSTHRKLAILLIATAMVSGCNPFKKGHPKTPVLGERISVLSGESDISVDPDTAALPFSLPTAEVNEEWAQSGGNPAHSMSHVALPASLGTAWTVSIGAGSDHKGRLISAPVVAAGRVYTIDTSGTVRAFDQRNGGGGVERQLRHRRQGQPQQQFRRRRRVRQRQDLRLQRPRLCRRARRRDRCRDLDRQAR